MRYVRSLKSLEKEIDILAQKCETDTTPQFSVMFDMPDNYRAKMILLKNGIQLLTIKSFSWKETEPLRRAMKFGSNHRCNKISFDKLQDIMYDMIDEKRLASFKKEVPEYDKRILNTS